MYQVTGTFEVTDGAIRSAKVLNNKETYDKPNVKDVFEEENRAGDLAAELE